jgi:hypothetical protein
MTREWLINARLREDFPESIRPRDREDIEEVMESCCHFITEQFLNLELTYRILGVQADAPEKIKKEMKKKMKDEAVTWTARDEEERYREQKAYRKKHKIPMER